MRAIRKCRSCPSYTMKTACPKCGSATREASPPKFSSTDKYGKYRRLAKKAKADRG